MTEYVNWRQSIFTTVPIKGILALLSLTTLKRARAGSYPVMIFSLCSILRCLKHRRVSADPISRVAPVYNAQSTPIYGCNPGKGKVCGYSLNGISRYLITEMLSLGRAITCRLNVHPRTPLCTINDDITIASHVLMKQLKSALLSRSVDATSRNSLREARASQCFPNY